MIRARAGDRVLQPRRNEAVATRTCSSRALHGALHRPRTIPLPHLRPNARPRNEVSTPATRFTDLAGPSRKARDRPIGDSRDTDEVARSHPAAERLAPQRPPDTSQRHFAPLTVRRPTSTPTPRVSLGR